jgi:heme-degrading monooxygenase HmoA
MFVAISSFEIENGLEDEVKQAFKNRPGLVENYGGFVRLDVFSPAENPSEIWLLTYWKSEESFKGWHTNHLKESHRGIPKGLKLVPHSFKLRFFNHIAS